MRSPSAPRVLATLRAAVISGSLAVPLLVLGAATPADAAATTVRINEIESSDGAGPDWVELVNVGAASVDVSGLVLKDSDDSHTQTIASGSLGAGAHLAVDLTDLTLEDADSARLYDVGGTTLLDSYAWTSPAATTYGRCDDASGAFTTTLAPTKGTTNACPVPDRLAPFITIDGPANDHRYLGFAPTPSCTATDNVSGPVACALAVTTVPDSRHHVTGLTATATDAAGNVAISSISYTVETTYLPGAVFRGGNFVVKRGKKYTVIALARTTPRLLVPASVPTTPTENGPKMTLVGKAPNGMNIYRAKLKMPRDEYGPFWYLGTRTDTLLQTRLKPSGKRIGAGPADL